MDINKEREAFERFKAEKIGIAYDELKTDLDDCERRFGKRYAGWNFSDDWELWQAVKAQAVPEGFVLVSKELPETIAEAMALERVPKPFGETDPVWIEISERSYRDSLLRKKWDLWRDYKAMLEAQEPSND
ncbi:hypothetical protein [Acinetobacter sp. Ver3]|uniref:hypothetical protein n=1 Tax=Acinetobacter sp. Ver3 TaxID=466088 RepID=UPI000553502C|nr:hypothetical protein [Acinetobacter sp. Ver3]